MSIRKLELGEPFFKVKFIQNEAEYYVEKPSIIINAANKSRRPIRIEGLPLQAVKATVVQNATLKDLECAILVENYVETAKDANIFEEVSKVWPTMAEVRPDEPRFKGLPFYRALGDGDLTPDIRIGISVFTAAISLGLHLDHPRDIDELHCQLLGTGAMQNFHERDFSTKYQDLNMCEGNIHDPMYDEEGKYNWHQYESYGPASIMGIQFLREKK